MLVDKAALGFGPRSWRYAMVVRDGVIDALFVEPEVEGDPFEVSDADTVLRHLGGAAPPDVALVTRPGCAHCERAKAALAGAGLAWTEVPASPRLLRALPGAGTTPQVFVDKQHIGGADELVAWLQGRAARGA
jgi:glutaredoxin